jgi:hypothetical protein
LLLCLLLLCLLLLQVLLLCLLLLLQQVLLLLGLLGGLVRQLLLTTTRGPDRRWSAIAAPGGRCRCSRGGRGSSHRSLLRIRMHAAQVCKVLEQGGARIQGTAGIPHALSVLTEALGQCAVQIRRSRHGCRRAGCHRLRAIRHVTPRALRPAWEGPKARHGRSLCMGKLQDLLLLRLTGRRHLASKIVLLLQALRRRRARRLYLRLRVDVLEHLGLLKSVWRRHVEHSCQHCILR